MVRHWFSLTAVLAVAVLIVVTDASQARERRLLGRRARRNTDSYVYYGPQTSGPYSYDSAGNLLPMPTENGAVASTQTDGRSAFYPPQNGRMMRPRTVLLEVRVPPNADVWIEGAKTTQKGTVRQFISPPLQPDRQFTYEIKAKWMDNGHEHEQTKKVDVRPGQVVRLDLTRPSEEKQ